MALGRTCANSGSAVGTGARYAVLCRQYVFWSSNTRRYHVYLDAAAATSIPRVARKGLLPYQGARRGGLPIPTALYNTTTLLCGLYRLGKRRDAAILIGIYDFGC